MNSRRLFTLASISRMILSSMSVMFMTWRTLYPLYFRYRRSRSTATNVLKLPIGRSHRPSARTRTSAQVVIHRFELFQSASERVLEPEH